MHFRPENRDTSYIAYSRKAGHEITYLDSFSTLYRLRFLMC